MCSALLGFEEKISSYEYRHFYWLLFEKFVDSSWPNPKCYVIADSFNYTSLEENANICSQSADKNHTNKNIYGLNIENILEISDNSYNDNVCLEPDNYHIV